MHVATCGVGAGAGECWECAKVWGEGGAGGGVEVEVEGEGEVRGARWGCGDLRRRNK